MRKIDLFQPNIIKIDVCAHYRRHKHTHIVRYCVVSNVYIFTQIN